MMKHLIDKFVLLVLIASTQWVLGQDLVVTSVTVNAPLYTGGGMSVSVSEMNIGTQTVVSHGSGFYVSSDSALSNDDKLLGSYTVDEIYGNQSKSVTSSSYSIPSTLPIGNYYVIIKADYQNKSNETNENNNTRAVKVNIEKGFRDFKFNSLKSPYLMAIKRGEGLELDISISNLGNLTGYFYISYFFYF